MKKILLSLMMSVLATTGYSINPVTDKFELQYRFENPSAVTAGLELEIVAGKCVISKWPQALGAQPTQAQVDSLVAAYDARMTAKQTAANALYTTISTRLEITITSKADLQSKLVDVWEALDTKEQAVWTAIEANGLNATRAGQLKQLAQARNKILRLLAEDGIQ